jgi:phage/plasmid-associated DNA primase
MPPKIAAKKSLEASKPPSVSSCYEEEIDNTDAEAVHKVQAIHSAELQSLNAFFNKSNMINASGDATTNIVDRYTDRCYKVPDNKIPLMFKLIEDCRKNNIDMMITEKQLEPSGLMFDFDIQQEKNKSQVTTEMLEEFCQNLFALLIEILDFKDKQKDTFYIGITRRPVISMPFGKQYYKDGFHILIPGIKVSRVLKKFIINKILDRDIITRTFNDVKPASMKMAGGEPYQQKHFLDINSAHVPVHFIGSKTKKNNRAYQLRHIFTATVKFSEKYIRIKEESNLISDINVSYEFSVNYEKPDGLIKKDEYTPAEKYLAAIAEMSNRHKRADDEINNNFGILSTNAVHDARQQEVKDLLDLLHPKRYEEYGMWRDVVFALAGTSTSYKDLAEYFSRKSAKFNLIEFENLWQQTIRGAKNKKILSIASIHYWARIDNVDRYEQLRKEGADAVLMEKVYEQHKEGILSHSDVADLVYKLLQHKYVTDVPDGGKKRVWYEFILDDDDHIDGELYKWKCCEEDPPVTIANYISRNLPNLFDLALKRIKRHYDESDADKSKWYKKVYDNFKATMRKLGDVPFIKNCAVMVSKRFAKCGFAKLLDKDPLVRGVQNGILKLGWGINNPPKLIQGYHSYKISKFTDVPYIAFDPYDPITKKILITLRGMFPDNESDSFDFTMYFLSSTLDGNPKESMIMLMVGGGSNGKSFLVELHKSAIGDTYGVKMQTSFLTSQTSSADAATPAIMQLKDATFAYYSETNKCEVLNEARMKEITGQETLSGRRLNENIINFKPKCHHLVVSNNNFVIQSGDHGTWRRIIYNPLKIRFVDTANDVLDTTDPFQREADVTITDEWTADPEIRGRYLGFMVWMHYWLYIKYRGKVMKVPHPHIHFETEKYRHSQDTVMKFLSTCLVKLADETIETPIEQELEKYRLWFQKTTNKAIPMQGLIDTFKNNKIMSRYIKTTRRGPVMVGHRFLDYGQKIDANAAETYAIQDVYELEMSEGNAGIPIETPEQYYQKVLTEYNKYKTSFDGNATYDVDPTFQNNIKEQFTRPNNIINGRVMPDGVGMRSLPEPAMNYLTDEYNFEDMSGYFSDGSDEPIDLNKERCEE